MENGFIKKSLSPILDDIYGNLIDEGIYGTSVEILDEYKDFFKIKTFYNYEGYILKDYIENNNEYYNYWSKLEKLIVVHNYISVSEKPDIKSNILCNLVKGDIVGSKFEEEENWTKIILLSGKEGFIRTKFLDKPIINYKDYNELYIRRNIVSTALSYMNTQYKWGGKSALGIDCSGLSFMSYYLNGAIIYRDAKFNNKYINEISIKDLDKSDLLFFPGHVGIYIGNSYYIHCSNANGKVDINSLNRNKENFNEKHYNSIIKLGSIF